MPEAERSKDGSLEEFCRKKHKEGNLALQNTADDLTSLSPLNEETGLNPTVSTSLMLPRSELAITRTSCYFVTLLVYFLYNGSPR